MSLVNDRNHSIEAPCPRSVFGRLCSEDDYRSWRKIAIAIRRAMFSGDYSEHPALWGDTMIWLREWAGSAEDCGLAQSIAAKIRAAMEPDPDMKGCAKYPYDLAVWSAGWSGDIQYNEQTDLLLIYIQNGYRLFVKAIDAGAIDPNEVPIALRRAQERPVKPLPSWAKYGIAAGLITGVATFTVWAIGTLRGTRRRE